MGANPTNAAEPAHESAVLFAKRAPFCVLIPVIDEGEVLHRQLDRMRALVDVDRPIVDVVISDGGTTDGSTDPALLGACGVRAVLRTERRTRLSPSLQLGFAFAMVEGYEGVITIDGNGKDGVDAIPRFVERLRAGDDFVQGSRFCRGGRHRNTPLVRHLGIRVLHAPIMRRLSGHPYSDTTNGFRGHSRRLLQDPRLALQRRVFDGYALPFYIAARAPRVGLVVTEIPVERTYPRRGRKSKLGSFRGPAELLAILYRIGTGSYDPR